MRERDKELVADVVARIANDEDVTRAEVIALLILLRESAPRKSGLRDLADAAAHRDRDRGDSFEYLNKWAHKWRIVWTHGFNRLTTDSLMPVREVITQLNGTLRQERIPGHIEADSHVMQCRVSDLLADALDETEFALYGARGRLTYHRNGNAWGHGAGIQQNDDIKRADGVVVPAFWNYMEWLNPEERCTEACTHRRPRI